MLTYPIIQPQNTTVSAVTAASLLLANCYEGVLLQSPQQTRESIQNNYNNLGFYSNPHQQSHLAELPNEIHSLTAQFNHSSNPTPPISQSNDLFSISNTHSFHQPFLNCNATEGDNNNIAAFNSLPLKGDSESMSNMQSVQGK